MSMFLNRVTTLQNVFIQEIFIMVMLRFKRVYEHEKELRIIVLMKNTSKYVRVTIIIIFRPV